MYHNSQVNKYILCRQQWKQYFPRLKITTAMTLCTKLQCRKITQNITPWVTFELEAGVYTTACYVFPKSVFVFQNEVLFRIAIFFNIFFKMMSLEILTIYHRSSYWISITNHWKPTINLFPDEISFSWHFMKCGMECDEFANVLKESTSLTYTHICWLSYAVIKINMFYIPKRKCIT